MFQLVNPTAVLLKHINLRQEKHGKAKVDALDFDFVLKGDHTLLALLDDRLPGALYYDPDAEPAQQTLGGLAPTPHKPRFSRISQIPWSMEGTGFDMAFHYGVDGETVPIEFGGGKASVKRAEFEGPVVTIFCRYATTDIPEGALDKLRTKVDRGTIDITLVQNERLREEFGGEAIDGTTEAFERDHPLFDGASDGPEDGDDSEGGEPDATDAFVEQHGEPGEFVNDNRPEVPGSGRSRRKGRHDASTAH
jgi:hypothetical protein